MVFKPFESGRPYGNEASAGERHAGGLGVSTCGPHGIAPEGELAKRGDPLNRAAGVTKTATLRGSTPISWAADTATGRTTRAAAALDRGWVRSMVRSPKTPRVQTIPQGADQLAAVSKRGRRAHIAAPETPEGFDNSSPGLRDGSRVTLGIRGQEEIYPVRGWTKAAPVSQHRLW